MPALCIVEDPHLGGLYTNALAPHAGIFERVGYVADSPLPGPLAACQHIPSGTPAADYSHILLVGRPEFIARQPIQGGMVYGAYVFSDSQFIPVENVAWAGAVQRVAVPSAMTGGALQLAYAKPITYREVRPWGIPVAPKLVINRTEIRQLLVPEWDRGAPVVLAYAEHADAVCAALTRSKNINALLLGQEDARHSVRIDLCDLGPERVRFTVSTLAWDAADLYLALNPFTAWPWDITHAIARQLPVAALRSYVYETFLADGHVAPINAFDTVTVGNRLAYQANSTDVAQAITAFTTDPVALHTRTQAAGLALAARTQSQFATDLLRALFSDS